MAATRPRLFKLGRGLLRERKIAIPDRHRGAGIQKALDDGAADALRATGNDRITSAEIDFIGHESPPYSKLPKPRPEGERG